jgi:outer membrane protein assembly factor BamB/predicted Ser/Thr protein kinase
MPDTTQFGGLDGDTNFEGTLKPNTVLLGRYEVTAIMGGGGQGAVYQARDKNFPSARRLVAVKEMHVTAADPVQKAASIRTFQREANLLATLSHPAIPKIYDFFDQNDRAYIIMEYINGSDLEALLVKTKKLPMNKIIEWAIDLCDVLYYLHNYQPEPVIFRDMKPANIMIDSLGKVRLIDFGIAKIFDSGIKKHTQIGTEGYSAPEQYKGLVTPLSDIYSLGATLHHVITRQDPRLEPPFSFAERPLAQYNPEATPQLASIIDKALSFESENRYQSCLEMKESLEALRYRAVQPAAAPVSAPTASKGATPSHIGADQSGTGFFVDVPDNVDAGIQPKWTFKTEDEIRSSPTSFSGMAYVGSYDTNLWALNLETGEFVWKRATEGGIASSPVVERELKQVFFGSEDYQFLSVDWKTGRIAWSYMTNDKIRSSGRLAHGHVFFGSDDGNLYAVLAGNGRQMWAYDTGSAVRGSPVVTNDRIIVGNDAGEVLGLELNGTRKWSFRTRKNVTSSPTVDIEGVCYIGSWDGFLYAIDAASGYSHWRFRTNGAVMSSPVVSGNLVYFTSTDGKLYAVNTQTGKDRWSFDVGKAIVGSPAFHQDVVYFGGTDGIFYAVDAKTGKENWRFQTGGPITSAPHIADNVILIGSTDATLYALPLVKK